MDIAEEERRAEGVETSPAEAAKEVEGGIVDRVDESTVERVVGRSEEDCEGREAEERIELSDRDDEESENGKDGLACSCSCCGDGEEGSCACVLWKGGETYGAVRAAEFAGASEGAEVEEGKLEKEEESEELTEGGKEAAGDEVPAGEGKEAGVPLVLTSEVEGGGG